MNKVLVINTGSTSTKVAVYEDKNPVFVESIIHPMEELRPFDKVFDQYEYRMNAVHKKLEEKNIDIKTLDAVVGRGGLVKPIEGGTYNVNDKMVEDLRTGIMGQHVTSLSGVMANEIANTIGVPSYIVDPVVIDEMEEVAKISGMPEIRRKSIFHALNQRACARHYAEEIGKKYEDINVIVAHMGGGVSIGTHRKGKIIDVNNALYGEGPFSIERTGSLPVGDLVTLCYSGKYTEDEMQKKIAGKGGFMAYLGTNDAVEIKNRIDNGDKYAELIYNAMTYQISKEIGAAAAVLCGKVDAILLTGGLAYGKDFDKLIADRVSFIAPVKVYPGGNEMLALAEGALRVLKGEEKAKEYK